jgi:hypothetical protein
MKRLFSDPAAGHFEDDLGALMWSKGRMDGALAGPPGGHPLLIVRSTILLATSRLAVKPRPIGWVKSKPSQAPLAAGARDGGRGQVVIF